MILEEKVIQLLKEYERLSKKELKKLLHKTPNDYVPVEETLKKLKKEKKILKDRLGRYYLAGADCAESKIKVRAQGVKGRQAKSREGVKAENDMNKQPEDKAQKGLKGNNIPRAEGLGKRPAEDEAGRRDKAGSKRKSQAKPSGREIEGRIALIKNKYAFFEGDGGQRLYIPSDKLMGAMLNDRVLAARTGGNGEDRGRVTAVLERANRIAVGTIENKEGEIYLVPDDYKLNIKVKLDKKEGLPENFKAVAEIYQYYEDGRDPQGRIIEILGQAEQPGAEMLSVLRAHNIPDAFPQPVIDEAERAPGEVQAFQTADREDLRNESIFTIDGIDAKDLDDAVSIRRDGENYVLGVHIADVSYYVRPDSALDGEALRRGTSVYFPGSVIPMLPSRLSNGICSLNPNVDRLAMSCEMHITSQGEVSSYRLFKSVIRSRERLVYEDVNKLLDGDEELKSRYSHIYGELYSMDKLAALLRKRRMNSGSIDFNTREPEFTLDQDGRAVDVRVHERGRSNMMIEEFMLLCNQTVARHMRLNKLPAVYRIHEKPEKSKVETFAAVIRGYGYNIKAKNLDKPQDYAKLLDSLKRKPEESVISRLMLRTMQKAKYSQENSGHFGLAAQDYLHFTSPIRRYPDLIVHRMLHFSMEQPAALAAWAKRLPAVALRASERERAAQEAEWEGDDIKKAEYMSGHVGEKFDGVISGMCSTAFWVELDNTVEGCVMLSSLKDDYYVFEQDKYVLTGRHTGRRFKLGQSVRIKVTGASVRARSVTFELAEKKRK